MPGIDFFDVDHTITRRSSGGRFIAMAIRKGLLPAQLVFVMLWYSFTYKVGLFRLREYGRGISSLRGVPRAELEAVGRESFHARLRTDIFAEAAELVRGKLRDGRRVVLATSSMDFIVAPLAEHLGIRDVVATALEFDGERCTGMIKGAPLFRKEKLKRVLAFMQEAGEDPRDCSFYSDSFYDLPLLQAVGTPVVVNPDWRLRRVARKAGWRILVFNGSPPAGSPGDGRPSP
jgi:HAD superfamily hydrolase (TIGR01490 family)